MSTESLAGVLDRLRALLLDDRSLVRAVASGRQKGRRPPWRRVEVRYVDLKAGRHLQVTRYDATQALTDNHQPGDSAHAAVDELLGAPFGNWHVDTTTHTHQVRVTKRGDALVHSLARDPADTVQQQRSHDRTKQRLLPEDDPVLAALGVTGPDGRVRAGRRAKYRQVEEFLRALGPAVDDALARGLMRTPTAARPLHVVDLGCGNAYLTFAGYRYLSAVRGLPVRLTGVDVKTQSLHHNNAVAAELGVGSSVAFVRGGIADVVLDRPPDVVLALHACDTATDQALARAVAWGAPLVLAAPCCHHDVAAQLRAAPTPAPYPPLTRDGILRERFADTLTDALRAAVLRVSGYRVDVVEFVESRHTPRNTLLRAVRTDAAASPQRRRELDELMRTWAVTPRLVELVDAPGD